MSIIKLALALCALSFTWAVQAAPKGLPVFNQKTAWTVLSCPSEKECTVPIKVQIVENPDGKPGCIFEVPDIVDHEKSDQHIVWKLVNLSPGFEVSLGHTTPPKGSIEFDPRGKDDVEDVPGGDKKQKRKKIKKQDTLLLTYNINVEFKPTNSTEKPDRCEHGPAIVNRG